MATRIRGLVANLGVRTRDLDRGLRQAENRWRRFRRTAGGDIRRLASITRTATIGITGSLALIGRSAFMAADEIAKGARLAGLSAGEFQALDLALRESGAQSEALATGIAALSRNVNAAAMGTQSAVDALAAFGLTAQQLQNVNLAEQLRLIAVGSRELDRDVRNANLQVLVGEGLFRSWGTLMETLNRTTIPELRNELQGLGLLFDESLLGSIEMINDQLGRLGTAAQAGFLRGISSAITETVNWDDIVRRVSASVELLTRQLVTILMWLRENTSGIIRLTAAWVIFQTTAFGAAIIRNIFGFIAAISRLGLAYFNLIVSLGQTQLLNASLTVSVNNLTAAQTGQTTATAANTAATAANTAAKSANTAAQAANSASLIHQIALQRAQLVATLTSAVSFRTLATVLRGVAVASLLVLGQFALMVAGIAAVSFAVSALYELFDEGFDFARFTSPFVRAFNFIEERGRLLGLSLQIIFAEVAAAFPSIFQPVIETFEYIENELRGTANFLRGLVGAPANIPRVEINTNFDEVLGDLRERHQQLLSELNSLSSVVDGAVGDLTEPVTDFAGRVADNLQNVLSPIITLYTEAFEALRTGELPENFLGSSVDDLAARLEASADAIRAPDLLGDDSVIGTASTALQEFFQLIADGAANLPEPPEVPRRMDFEGAVTRGVQDFNNALGRSLTEGLREGDFSAVGEALRDNLIRSFTTNLGDSLAEAFTDFLSGIVNSAFGSGSSNNVFAALGGFLPFHEGGFVPGRTGQEVPILAQAGELVLTEEQQRGFGNNVSVTLNVTGDVTDATRRAVLDIGPEIANTVRTQFEELRVFPA